ncbi:NADPH-dependent FMN reductase [Taibaiella koreensis]|uniref:NADPH-dependent FMN reductase n=1 Tax=Taibaiella koreensis TaxID=1268548 RepID=UPI000E59F8D8|nr:NADPH-dependent FMN reductase [Taibaiella koreensis]
MVPLHILAISGSVRAASSNHSLLKAIVHLLPPTATLSYSIGVDQLPPFNPDHDQQDSPAPEAVATFRRQIADAAAVLICTPEYAFGIPGTLKNALDWTVSSGSLNDKPVAAITASPLYTGGDKAMASLLPTLKALGTLMPEPSTLCIPSVNKLLSPDGALTDPAMTAQLQQLIDHLVARAIMP